MEEFEKKHIDMLREHLSECMVLLKKNGDFPLSTPSDIALYGNGVRRTIKGGTGSGEVNSRYFNNIETAFINAGFNIKTKDWLDKYDEAYLKGKKTFKKHLKEKAKKLGKPVYYICMGEVMPEYDYDIPVRVECDTAIYVLSRISGEGSDRRLLKGDVFLTDTEINTINYLNTNYKKFMLVLNVGGVVDLSKVNNVKNILLLSQLGVETSEALVDVVLGIYSPSGKLTTTWTSPGEYSSMGDFGNIDDNQYREGLYVGYRYFDSLKKDVLYPFGFGLTYTEFEINYKNYRIEDNYLYINANVKNIGKYSAKEVVECYVSKPNDIRNNPYQDLVGFEKTELLNPGEEGLVELKIDINDFRVYDTESKTYVLDKGEYVIRLGNSSRKNNPVLIIDIDNTIELKRCKNLFNKVDFNDYSVSIKRNESLDKIEHVKYNSTASKEVVNYDLEVEIPDVIKNLSDSDLIKLNMGLFNEKGGLVSVIGSSGKDVPGSAGETRKLNIIDRMIMADGPQGLRLARDYFIEKGEKYSTTGIIPESLREYFPWYILFLMKRFEKQPKKNTVLLHQYTTAIPIGSAVAQSFNKAIAYALGDIVGREMEIFNVDLWLAPALNIHRNILCGRNFEYYSEDPFVSGTIAASITNGVQSHKGKGVTVKHFLANNQEDNRYANNSVVSERTLREIYARGFEMCIRDSKPFAVMTSYNLVNGIHTNEDINVNDRLLRADFKHEGIVMTDWIVSVMHSTGIYSCANPVNVLKAHSDLFMPGSKEDFDRVLDAMKKGYISRDDLEINASRLYKFIKKVKE